MLTHTMIGLPVAFETRSASSNDRCHAMRQGFFQSSAVGAAHIVSRDEVAGRLGGEPKRMASFEGAPGAPGLSRSGAGGGVAGLSCAALANGSTPKETASARARSERV